ncbi:MAG: hypothetical protein ACE5KJ_02965 [Candidatus Zixiibacteriota bacterium]
MVHSLWFLSVRENEKTYQVFLNLDSWEQFFDASGIGIPEAEASAIPIADASENLIHS